MSAAKKQKPYVYPEHSGTADKRPAKDTQEELRQVKLTTERLREKLQHSILDNPKLSKKAALLISLWINAKKDKKEKK